jgi:hypothetical protein
MTSVMGLNDSSTKKAVAERNEGRPYSDRNESTGFLNAALIE